MKPFTLRLSRRYPTGIEALTDMPDARSANRSATDLDAMRLMVTIR